MAQFELICWTFVNFFCLIQCQSLPNFGHFSVHNRSKIFDFLHSLIINGEPSPHSSFYVKVKTSIPGFHLNFCGGTLIHARWVVTAAHCLVLNEGSVVAVEYGEYSSRQRTMRTVNVADIFIPPGFEMTEPQPRKNIALLFLTSPICFNHDHVVPLCEHRLPIGTMIVASGMGCTSERSNYFPRVLQQAFFVETPAAPSNDPFELIQCPLGNICTRPVTQGGALCRGDEGGPLFGLFNDTGDNIWRVSFCLYGIASCSLHDGHILDNFENYFTSVPDNFLWILSKIALM
ncbi:chymotrypsinogen B-like isoform X2 [Convolutriloba macropyga]|uniref:chymotrypsinogen B-like isoform X2 n=1 Tax=Convolutriloba macropyga TaxID=536237 RepID=UPI003F51E0E4